MKVEYKFDQLGTQSVSLSIEDIPNFLKEIKDLFQITKKKNLFDELQDLSDYAYKIVMKDLILDEGNSKYGWGHSYLKLVKDIYP